MKYYPIIMTAESVRGILDGTKTMTRRVVKPQPHPDIVTMTPNTYGNWEADIDPNTPNYQEIDVGTLNGFDEFISPYGGPGDRLWVRETHAINEDSCDCGNGLVDNWIEAVHYRADGASVGVERDLSLCSDWDTTTEREAKYLSWRPSIHMPRWASRINLEVTAVRVERVQEITDDDAEAEGIDIPSCFCPDIRHCPQVNGVDVCDLDVVKDIFAPLWDSINGKPRKDGVDISWEANPWVWCVSFRKVTT